MFNINILEKKINFIFKNKNLLIKAISHKSYTLYNNEKLEFLGDSILNYVITKYIYKNFNYLNEGDMTKIRSFLVNSKTIIKIFKKFKINKYIKLKNIYKISNSILENIFESLIGAMFLDKGILLTEKFIIYNYKKYFNLINNYSIKIIKDNKTSLQELTRKKFSLNPIYILSNIKYYKNNKQKFFIKCILINNNINIIKNGIGRNKKTAEESSAKKMINFIINNFT